MKRFTLALVDLFSYGLHLSAWRLYSVSVVFWKPGLSGLFPQWKSLDISGFESLRDSETK
jgi:hypothetical protein